MFNIFQLPHGLLNEGSDSSEDALKLRKMYLADGAYRRSPHRAVFWNLDSDSQASAIDNIFSAEKRPHYADPIRNLYQSQKMIVTEGESQGESDLI